ncbi:MAG TPA: alpha/beta fold hydrolase [Limnobacter sp.]|uniref:alpha/beta fold hydrolase n=1 Tax=Limnobacter sp. TaxID=2003368 RepID=UPI002ED936AC
MSKQANEKYAIEHHTIAVHGANLQVLVGGEGPEVLLVHGFPDDHTVWRKQIPALIQAGFRVIAPDLRGFGESSLPKSKSAYHLSHLTNDLAMVLDALHVEKAHVVGHDWGAIIGWFFTMGNQDRVLSYTAMSVGHPLAYAKGGLAQKLKGWYTVAFQVPWVSEALIKAGNWTVLRKFTGQTEEAERWIDRMRRPGRLTAGLNLYRANVDLILARKYPDITVPVMGVWSDGDRYLAESQMVDSGKLVKGPWEYHRIEGASHWFQLEKPMETNALLINYLKHHAA